MSVFDALIQGKRLPDERPLSRPATDFTNAPRVSTGKAESEWLGNLLILMAAQGGTWHKVPWRMLRNRYMRYGRLDRLRLCLDKKPVLLEKEPIVTHIMGGSKPIEEILIGVMDMVQHGLVELTVERDETYFAPNEKLLGCIRGPVDLAALTKRMQEDGLLPLGTFNESDAPND